MGQLAIHITTYVRTIIKYVHIKMIITFKMSHNTYINVDNMVSYNNTQQQHSMSPEPKTTVAITSMHLATVPLATPVNTISISHTPLVNCCYNELEI